MSVSPPTLQGAEPIQIRADQVIPGDSLVTPCGPVYGPRLFRVGTVSITGKSVIFEAQDGEGRLGSLAHEQVTVVREEESNVAR
jgi:hypothetical protein